MSNTARSVHDEYKFDMIRKVFQDSKRILERTRCLESVFRERLYDNRRFIRDDDDDNDNDDDYDDGF